MSKFTEIIVQSVNKIAQSYVNDKGVTKPFLPLDIYLVPKTGGTHDRYVVDENGVISKQAGGDGGSSGGGEIPSGDYVPNSGTTSGNSTRGLVFSNVDPKGVEDLYAQILSSPDMTQEEQMELMSTYYSTLPNIIGNINIGDGSSANETDPNKPYLPKLRSEGFGANYKSNPLYKGTDFYQTFDNSDFYFSKDSLTTVFRNNYFGVDNGVPDHLNKKAESSLTLHDNAFGANIYEDVKKSVTLGVNFDYIRSGKFQVKPHETTISFTTHKTDEDGNQQNHESTNYTFESGNINLNQPNSGGFYASRLINPRNEYYFVQRGYVDTAIQNITLPEIDYVNLPYTGYSTNTPAKKLLYGKTHFNDPEDTLIGQYRRQGYRVMSGSTLPTEITSELADMVILGEGTVSGPFQLTTRPYQHEESYFLTTKVERQIVPNTNPFEGYTGGDIIRFMSKTGVETNYSSSNPLTLVANTKYYLAKQGWDWMIIEF